MRIAFFCGTNSAFEHCSAAHSSRTRRYIPVVTESAKTSYRLALSREDTGRSLFPDSNSCDRPRSVPWSVVQLLVVPVVDYRIALPVQPGWRRSIMPRTAAPRHPQWWRLCESDTSPANGHGKSGDEIPPAAQNNRYFLKQSICKETQFLAISSSPGVEIRTHHVEVSRFARNLHFLSPKMQLCIFSA